MNSQYKTIMLRKIVTDDIDTLLALTGNPEVIRHIPGMIQDREYATSWIAGLKQYDHECMILLDGSVIGECSLTVKGDSGEIGLMIFPEFWRKGYGTETVRLLMDMAISLGLKQVTATTSAENEACVGLLRKLGFTTSGFGWMLNEENFDKPLDQQFSVIMYHKQIKTKKDKSLGL